ncbi:DUF2087 domain-containing protein, partial [Litorisediminicola beolgyonensis]
MTRQPVSLTIPDLSRFARSLRGGLAQPPGQQETLNLLARAAGFRNFQHLSARQRGAPPPADAEAVARALRAFDG